MRSPGFLPTPEASLFPTRPRWAFWLDWILLPLDRLFNRLYSSRYNPLMQSGTLAVLFFIVLVSTGLYLLLFYRIGGPYESVARLDAQWWGGRWIRGLHSYAGDATMIAVLFHMLRMLIRGKTWGPRALAWVSGVFLLGLLLLSGWTGLVLVWDIQGELVAVQGAKLLDYLPIFSEPIQRAFTDPAGVARGFFFLNLILHMVVPFLLVATMWIHTQRVSRPTLLPPRKLSWWALAALLGITLFWPLDMLPKGDPLVMAGRIPVDWFYGIWMVVARNAPPLVTFAVMLSLGAFLASMPWWWRPGKASAPAPARVNEDLCTGCTQCYQDCPYEAIAMVPPPEGRTDVESVGRVNPNLCVSCGICAGSCGPMLAGPPLRTGRDHLLEARRFMAAHSPGAEDVVVMACAQGVAKVLPDLRAEGFLPYPVHCVGSTHTSAMEYLIRSGTGGIYLLGCPTRDCLYREGPRWVHERIYNDREAELQPRVDKARIQVGTFGVDEAGQALRALRAFRDHIRGLTLPPPEAEVDVDPFCEVMEQNDALPGQGEVAGTAARDNLEESHG